MVLQNCWVVSCNYKGEIWGVELCKTKNSKYRLPKLSKEFTAVAAFTKDKSKNQLYYNHFKKEIINSLKHKYKDFEIVISRANSAIAPFKVEQYSVVEPRCWGNAKILWSERD